MYILITLNIGGQGELKNRDLWPSSARINHAYTLRESIRLNNLPETKSSNRQNQKNHDHRHEEYSYHRLQYKPDQELEQLQRHDVNDVEDEVQLTLVD